MSRFSHMFTLAYELESADEDGSDVTATMHAAALLARISDILKEPGDGFDEAVGKPDDTHEVGS